MEESSTKPITITGLLFEFIGTHKYMLVLYICFLAIMPIKDIGIPHLFGKLVKSIEDKSSLMKPLIYLFIVTIIMHIGYSIIDLLEVNLNPQFQAFVRQKVIRHIIEYNDTNMSEIETGKVISRLMRLPTGLYGYLNQWKYILIPNLILSVAAVIYFTYYERRLGILLMILISFSWFMILYSVQRCLKYSYPSEMLVMQLYEQVDDIMKNMMTVLTSSQQEQELNNLQNYEDVFKEYVKKTLYCSLKMRYIIVPFNIAYFAYFIYTGFNMVTTKKMKPSVFVALVIVMFKVFNSIWDISGIMNDAITRWGLLKQSMNIFNEKPKKHSSNEMCGNILTNNGLLMKNISFSYYTKDGIKRDVFKNFSLFIPKHQKLVIMGGIGSGKSTIIKLFLKQILPSSGKIYLHGICYDSITTKDIRKQIGYVQQHPVLFNRTIYENITYGVENTSRHEVNKLIDKLNLRDMFNKFPKGLNTLSGKYGSNLSGGQRQIIILLRVLLQNPPILCMDEPTASIDKKTKVLIYNIISKLIKDKTVIIVSHDSYMKTFGDRLIILNDGKISEDTTK
jgi:ABC-type multidrug transport system fused ATPase/permease subunit